MKKIWIRADNADATNTLKQHCYITFDRKIPYTLEPYIGNKMLCNSRGGLVNPDELFVDISDLSSEKLDVNKCCKKCLSMYYKNI